MVEGDEEDTQEAEAVAEATLAAAVALLAAEAMVLVAERPVEEAMVLVAERPVEEAMVLAAVLQGDRAGQVRAEAVRLETGRRAR